MFRTPRTLCRLSLAALCPALLFCLSLLAAADPACAGPVRVSLLLESGAADGGACDLMRAGLERTSAAAGAASRVVICPPDAGQTQCFRAACESSDLVIVAEPRLHMILRDNAANYRAVSFGCVDTGVRAPNIMSVTFADEEPAFLAGALAAMLLEQEQRLGFLEDEEGPVHDNLLAAFIAGARVQRPSVRVLRRQTGFASSDTAALQEMAAENVGVTALAAGASAPAQLNAVNALPLYVVAMDAGHFAAAPEKIPFSVVKRYDRAVEELVRAKADGGFRGKTILVYDLANGGVDLALNPAFNGGRGVPAALRTRLADLRRELASGNIRLEDKRIPTLCDCLD